MIAGYRNNGPFYLNLRFESAVAFATIGVAVGCFLIVALILIRGVYSNRIRRGSAALLLLVSGMLLIILPAVIISAIGRATHPRSAEYVRHAKAISYQAIGKPEKDAPFARLPKAAFEWLGGITLGMSRSEVEGTLKSKTLALKATGRHVLVNSTLGNWTATLKFSTNALTGLSITEEE